MPRPVPDTSRRGVWGVRVAGLLALLAGLVMLAYPLLPVREHTATYRWDSADPHMALPLNPYRPAAMHVELDCHQRAATMLWTGNGLDEQLAYRELRINFFGSDLRVGSNLHTVLVPFPADCTTITVDLTGAGIRAAADGRPLTEHGGDWRPVVDSLHSDTAHGAVRVTVVPDTQWDSSPTGLKTAAAWAAAVLLIAAWVLLWRVDRPRSPARLGFRAVTEDAVVLAVTAFGVVASAGTDDDGFIAQIVRGSWTNGFVGNYVRWNNAPEAPFGWFYVLYAAWARFSTEPVWLRLLPWVLSVSAWLVLRHALLPRLMTRPGVGVRVAVTAWFLALWQVYANSLRPEVWFALGLGVVTWLVADALERRSVRPLLIAALVAGWTAGTGPTGIVAVAPFIVRGPSIWRFLGERAIRLPAGAALLATFGSVVLAMFSDQTLASVMAANEARNAYGPVFPFWSDPLRYVRLVESFQDKQLVTYVAFVAVVFAGAVLVRGTRGRLKGPALVDLVGSAAVLAVALMLSPTKLAHHFGALLLLGPLALAVVVEGVRRFAGAVSSAVVVGTIVAAYGLSLRVPDNWWALGTVGVYFDGTRLSVGGVPVAWLVCGFAVAVAVAVGVGVRTGRRQMIATGMAGVLAIVTAASFADFAAAPMRRAPGYSLAAASWDAIQGRGCFLERTLLAEVDPLAGALRPAAGDEEQFGPGGPFGLGMWIAREQRSLITPWYDLPEPARAGELPVVVAVQGIDARHRVRVEFSDGGSVEPQATDKTVDGSAFVDVRAWNLRGAQQVRVVAEGDGRDGTDLYGRPVEFAVSRPRVPTGTVPVQELVGSGRMAVAWNLAYFFPCWGQPTLVDGRAQPADWVVSNSADTGNVGYRPRHGGPFSGVLDNAARRRVPIYSPYGAGELELDLLDLVRLEHHMPQLPDPERSDRVRWGWEATPAVP
ncbi:arabinosyltransferase domain-containing protein [Mariniluteicoccus endophyticus]